MDSEFSPYLIYCGILLCLCIVLFYLFYKLRVKINEISDKVDKIDKLLAEIFINKELELATSRENINTENNSKSKKKGERRKN